MEMIVCENLTRVFGSLTAVDNLCLSVKEGELFGFLGPNGAGKTTTIRMITGLLHPTSGTARIGGFDIQSHPREAKRILGYIPDNPFLYEKLTGREFLRFMADLYEVDRTDRNRRMEDLLHLFALESKGDALIQGFSRGMRQKLALAGALIHSPKAILLDEPTVGLDPQSARAMQDILRELCRRGTTVFISTHILGIAERLCDRVAIFDRGRIVAQGTVAELRDASPAPGGCELSEPESLEDIFLRLTGGMEHADLIRYLDGEAG